MIDENRRSLLLTTALATCVPTLAKTGGLLDALFGEIPRQAIAPSWFPSRASAMTTRIPAAVDVIRILGWFKPGDGGLGDFVRMDGSTPLLTPPAASAVQLWHFQSADSAWWLRTTAGPVNFQMFGAVGSGNDDTDAIQAALVYHPTVFAGRQPVVLMLPGNHAVSKPITCMALSPCITTGSASDDLVTIVRATKFAGHTFQFGNSTTSCQRLVLEGIHFDVPISGHWVNYAGKVQQNYTDGAVIVAMTPVTIGSASHCRLVMDQPHELISGNRVFLSQTIGSNGLASAYDRRTFLAVVLNPTDIYLADLDGSLYKCGYRQSLSGDGSAHEFTVTHGMGTYQVDISLEDADGAAFTASGVTAAAATLNTVQIHFPKAPAKGETYLVKIRVPNIVPGRAGVTTGPLCSKVHVDAGYEAKVTAISQAQPCAVTFASHAFVPGDLLAGASIGGMTQLNGNNYTVGSVDGNIVTLIEPGAGPLDSTKYDAFTSGGAFAVVAQGFPSYVTATLDNLITDYYHVMAFYPVRGRFSRLQGFRTKAPLCVIGDAYCEYDKVVIGGIWDEDRPGLQETLAGIYLPTAETAIRTLPTIKSPGLISSGTASAPRLVRRGNAAVVQKKDTGCRDAIYCEQAEGFELYGGYLGGHNRSMVHFKAMSILVHVNIHDMFMDGSGGYGIHFEVGTSATWNVTIHDINSNGGDVSEGLIKVDDGTSILPIPHVNSMTIHHCTGQGYRGACISMLGVVGAEIDANELNGYNQLNDTSGDPTLSSAIYIGPHSSRVSLLGGLYGGGINMTIAPNNCRWGVYAASPGAAVGTNLNTGFLGQAGGGVVNSNVCRNECRP